MRLAGNVRWVCLSFWLAWSATAVAQPASAVEQEAAPDPVADARARGQALLAEGRPAEAERVYLEAFGATAAPALLRDVSDARFAAGDGPGAAEALERYLAAVPEGAEAESARQRLAELQQMPATVEIGSTPSGAEVRIDGEVVGTTPLRREVAPGEHALEVSLSGHATARETVVVAFASRRAVNVALDAAPAEVVEVAPIEAVMPPDVERDTSATPAVWALSGVSAAALLTGTIFGFKALSEESDFVVAPTDSGADRGERYALTADIAFGVAAATAVTAFILWVRGDDDPAEGQAADAVRVRLVAAPRGAGLGAGIEF